MIFDQIFLSSQGKRSVIIGNEHGIYELPHELPYNSKLRILEHQEILGKSQNFMKLMPSVERYSKNESFVNDSQKKKKNRN